MQEDAAAFAKLKLEEMLTFFGVNTSASVEENDGLLELKVDASNASGRLIGYRGENLRAIQYLLNQLLQNYTQSHVYAVIDISDYKKARTEQLTAKAKEIAQKVLDTGKGKALKPMNAADRRIIHVALTDVKGVITESSGEEPRRRVVIKKTN